DVTLPDGRVRHYDFDVDSNRLDITELPAGAPAGTTPTTVATYTYDPAVTPGVDELTRVQAGSTTTAYTYTADGQAASRAPTTFAWAGRGRIAGGHFTSTLTYTYDPLGRLTKRVGGGQTTTYTFAADDGSPQFEVQSGAITSSVDESVVGALMQYAGAPGG